MKEDAYNKPAFLYALLAFRRSKELIGWMIETGWFIETLTNRLEANLTLCLNAPNITFSKTTASADETCYFRISP